MRGWILSVMMLGASVVCPALTAHAQAATAIEASVDERVELAAVVARLAGFEEFQAGGIASYDADVARHFHRHGGHPAVALLKQFRQQRSVGYGDTVALAVLASDARWAPRVPIDTWLAAASTHWDSASAAQMLQAMAQFAVDSQADAFFARHRADYQTLTAGLQAALPDGIDAGWFNRLDAGKPPVRLHTVLALLHGTGNYGPRVAHPDGSLDAWAILAVPPAQRPAAVHWQPAPLRRLLVHETAHAWANPWVDRHADALHDAARQRLQDTAQALRGGAYEDAQVLLYETVTRALTARYLFDHQLPAQAQAALDSDAQQGLWWTSALAEAWAQGSMALLDDSRVGALQQVLAAPMTAASGTTLLQQRWPADGSSDVDPALTTLRLRFARPMQPDMGVFGERLPDFKGRPQWSADGRELVFAVQMAAGQRYEMQLNDADSAGGFRSRDGARLPPTRWRWQTAGPRTGADR